MKKFKVDDIVVVKRSLDHEFRTLVGCKGTVVKGYRHGCDVNIQGKVYYMLNEEINLHCSSTYMPVYKSGKVIEIPNSNRSFTILGTVDDTYYKVSYTSIIGTTVVNSVPIDFINAFTRHLQSKENIHANEN